MKVKNKNSQKNVLIAVTILVFFIAAGLLLFKKYHANTLVSPVQNNGPTSEQKTQESKINADIKNQTINDKGASNSTNPPATNSTQSIELTARQEDNNTVTVFTKLPGYSSGTCILKATNGSKSTTQSATVYYQPEYSSCAGFSVPISGLDAGNWTLTLNVTSNGKTTSATISQEVH